MAGCLIALDRTIELSRQSYLMVPKPFSVIHKEILMTPPKAGRYQQLMDLRQIFPKSSSSSSR